MAAVERYAALAGSSAARWGRALGVSVPLELVLAVMQQENPAAEPRAFTRESGGRISRGLMMVLEDTARGLGLKDPLQLHDPATGIDVGVHYLAQQLMRYSGSVPRAIAAYNAGSVRYTADEAFVNQGYVDRVLRFLRDFQRGPGPGIAAAILALLAIAFAGWKSQQPVRNPRRRRRRVHA